MVVLRVTREPPRHLVERQLRKNRHAIEVLLAVDRHVVAERFERLAREALVHTLGFLQTDDVGVALAEPCWAVFGPLPDGVHVPGGYPHGCSSALAPFPMPTYALLRGIKRVPQSYTR